MFLALTAIKSLWNQNSKILFLGRWCIRDKKNIKNINYEIVDYHWDDQEKVEKDNTYIFNTYKKFMPILANKLNIIQKQNLNQRYWEILVGVWFVKFIEVMFDRYTIINNLKKYNNLETIITNEFITIEKFDDFYWNSQEDYYNFFLFSFLIKELKLNIKILDYAVNVDQFPSTVRDNINDYVNNSFKYKDRNIIEKVININLNTIKNIIKKNKYFQKYIIFPIKYLIYFIKKPISSFLNKTFYNLSLPISGIEKKNLYKKFNQLYNLNPIKQKNKEKLFIKNFASRNTSLSNFNNFHYDEFQIFILKHTLKFIPKEYLEYFNFNRSFYKKNLPKRNPKIVAVRCPLEYNTDSRFITAELNNLGSKILSCQEGGGMNVRKINKLDEELNFIGCDNFLTWGWKPKNINSIRFFMTKTFWLDKNKIKSNGHILLIGGSCRRYHWSVYEGQLLKFNQIHINKNISFLKKLDKNLIKNLIYRFHVQYGENEIKNVVDEIPNIKISLREDTSVDFYRILYDSKLVINTSDYTANLQSLIINIPTIWYWDREYHTIREESKVYYNILYEHGILFYDEDKFLQQLKEVVKNPLEWWNSDKIQLARKMFCDNFCRVTPNIENKFFEVSNLIVNQNK